MTIGSGKSPHERGGESRLSRPGRENPFERVDVRFELDSLTEEIESLRIHFEQFFTGLLPLAPDKQHADVKRRIRKLLRAPFRNSEMNFRLKTLEGRYNTLHSYWQRVMREREEGTYSKDVFKANLRERTKLEEARAHTAQGAAEKAMKQLFSKYKEALESHTGRTQNIDYQAFQKAIVQRTREFKERNKGQKVSFKVVVSEGKVTIKASPKVASG
jgi:hypothetical protein